MSTVKITFTKHPEPQQLVRKAAGVIQRSKVSVTQILLTFRDECITLNKDQNTKEWTGTGKIGNITAKEIV